MRMSTVIDKEYMIRKRPKRINYNERCGVFTQRYGMAVKESDDDCMYVEENEEEWH